MGEASEVGVETLVIYEAGVRNPNGEYCTFITSPKREAVDEYIEIMKTTVSNDFEILMLEKTYQLVFTVPHVVATIEGE